MASSLPTTSLLSSFSSTNGVVAMIEGGGGEDIESETALLTQNNNNSSNNASSSMGIASVAAKIQERALQLVAERQALETAKNTLKEKHTVFENKKEKYEKTRRTFLSAERSRHGVELEYWKFCEASREKKRSIELLQNDIQDLEEHKQKLQEHWEQTIVKKLFADHRMKQELYQRIMEGNVKSEEEKTRKRSLKLQKLFQLEQNLATKMEDMKKENEIIHKEIQLLEKQETDEDEEISAIGMQVRETLAKRRSLREKLGIEQKAYQEANEEMQKREKKA